MERTKIHELHSNISNRKKAFEATIKDLGKKAIDKIREKGYDEFNFLNGLSGVYGYLNKISKTNKPGDFPLSIRANDALNGPEKWVRKEDQKDDVLISFIETELLPILKEIHLLISEKYKVYTGDISVLKTLFLFGIVNEIGRAHV